MLDRETCEVALTCSIRLSRTIVAALAVSRNGQRSGKITQPFIRLRECPLIARSGEYVDRSRWLPLIAPNANTGLVQRGERMMPSLVEVGCVIVDFCARTWREVRPSGRASVGTSWSNARTPDSERSNGIIATGNS